MNIERPLGNHSICLLMSSKRISTMPTFNDHFTISSTRDPLHCSELVKSEEAFSQLNNQNKHTPDVF